MARINDVQANLKVAKDLRQQIQAEYNSSLQAKSISPTLPVYIKNFLENLRSPLDYLALEISERILNQPKGSKVYFPIACTDQQSFNSHIARNLPNLDKINSQLFFVLESFQAYQNGGCKILPKLASLVNQNKHSHLSPQTRTESKGLNIQFPGGGSISMGPGSSISGGGFISSGGGWFTPGGGLVSGNSPAQVGKNIQQTITTWVSFTFTDGGEEVLPILDGCLRDVDRVVNELSKILWV